MAELTFPQLSIVMNGGLPPSRRRREFSSQAEVEAYLKRPKDTDPDAEPQAG